jgi:hypothetical protein
MRDLAVVSITRSTRGAGCMMMAAIDARPRGGLDALADLDAEDLVQ